MADVPTWEEIDAQLAGQAVGPGNTTVNVSPEDRARAEAIRGVTPEWGDIDRQMAEHESNMLTLKDSIQQFGVDGWRGLANLIGMPADLVMTPINFMRGLVDEYMVDAEPGYQRRAPLKPYGGSKDVEALFNRLGIVTRRKATTEAGEMFGKIGENVVPALAIGGGVAATATQRAAEQVPNIGPVMRFAAEKTGKFLMGETALATAGGGGAYAASEVYPESPIGELIGNVAATTLAAIGGRTVSGVSRAARSATDTLDPRFAKNAAAAITQRTHVDPVKAYWDIENFELPIPGAEFTAGQMAADAGGLALERGIIRSSAATVGTYRQMESNLNLAYRRYAAEKFGGKVAAADETIQGPGTGNPLREFFSGQSAGIVNLLDRRLNSAIAEADAKIARLPKSNRSPAEISAIARDSLESAYKDARAQENFLWGQIDRTSQRSTQPIKDALEEIKAGQNKASDPSDYPGTIDSLFQKVAKEAGDEIRGNLSRLEAEWQQAVASGNHAAQSALYPQLKDARAAVQELAAGRSGIAEIESLDVVMTLRNRMLEMAREQRAPGGNRTLAANLTKLADAALDVMATPLSGAGDQQKIMDAAREYSRKLNDAFTRGPVGDVLALDRKGGKSVLEERTLQSLGINSPEGGGQAARMYLDAEAFVKKAIESNPDLFKDSKFLNDAPMRDSLREYVIKKFDDAAFPNDGPFNAENAARFRTRYRDLLKQEAFKDLDQQFDQAVASERRRLGAADARSAYDKKRGAQENALSLWLDMAPDKAMSRVLDMGDPARAMKELVGQAKRDPSGQAMEGLKRAFFDEMMARVRISARDANDIDLSSAAKMRQFRQKNAGAIGELYTPEEMAGLGQIEKALIIGERGMVGLRGGSDTAQNQAIQAEVKGSVRPIEEMIRGLFAVGKVPGGLARFFERWTFDLLKGAADKQVEVVNSLLRESVFDPKLRQQLLIMNPEIPPPAVRHNMAGHIVNLLPTREQEDGR